MRKAVNEFIGAALVTAIHYPATTIWVFALLLWLCIYLWR